MSGSLAGKSRGAGGRTLIVERNPLRLSCPFNPFESDGAVVAGDACEDDVVACKVLEISKVLEGGWETHCFLLEGVAGCLGVDSAVFLSFDRFVLAGFAGEVSRIVLRGRERTRRGRKRHAKQRRASFFCR